MGGVGAGVYKRSRVPAAVHREGMPRSFWLPEPGDDVLSKRPDLYNLEDVLRKHIEPSSGNVKKLEKFLENFSVEIIETEKSDDFVYEMHDNDVLYVSAKVVWSTLFKLLDEQDIIWKKGSIKTQILEAEEMKEKEGWIRMMMCYGHMVEENYLPSLAQFREFQHKNTMYKLTEEAAELENEKKKLEIELLKKKLGKSNKRARDESSSDEL